MPKTLYNLKKKNFNLLYSEFNNERKEKDLIQKLKLYRENDWKDLLKDKVFESRIRDFRNDFAIDSLDDHLYNLAAGSPDLVTPIVFGERISHQRPPESLKDLPEEAARIMGELRQVGMGEDCAADFVNYYTLYRGMLSQQHRLDGNRVAILVSTHENDNDSPDLGHYNRIAGRFYQALFSKIKEFDGISVSGADLVQGATRQTLERVLKDSRYSSIVTIGHGRYGVWAASDGAIDWATSAEYTKRAGHLKSGFWLQLSCMPNPEQEPIGLQIPFGYFAMRDPNNVLSIKDDRDDGLFYAEEFVGADKEGNIKQVNLQRISGQSFMPQMEQWRQSVLGNHMAELLLYHSVRDSKSPDEFWRRMSKHEFELARGIVK